MPLLAVEHLTTRFHTRHGLVRAVEDVSLSIDTGETVGIVGESGSGKSVFCYSLLGLIPQPPGRIEGGSVLFDGMQLQGASARTLRSVRGKRISMIFQDPMTALNPFMRIGKQVMEPLLVHEKIDRKKAYARAIEALARAGLHDPEQLMRRYPHDLSGGMRQRVMIAMALIGRPDLIIADEPTTALDVTVQAQILELITALRKSTGVAVIFITHDLGMVAGMCDRVAVMYAGRVLEQASTDALFARSLHPYTRALRKSIPSLGVKGEPLYSIPGSPPDLTGEIAGCPFAPRCESAIEECRTRGFLLSEIERGHSTGCFRMQEKQIL